MDSWRPVPPGDLDDARTPLNGWRSWCRRNMAKLRWFGWGRLITAAICLPLVGIGGFFLVRTPDSPVEASLGSVPTSSSVPFMSTTVWPMSVETTVVARSITIHVAGNVIQGGVYILPIGSRVVDAIRTAGGASMIADLNAINLAVILIDGQQVYVPAIGERPPGSMATGSGVGSAMPGSASGFPVNINSADATALDALPGVGPATAQAIVSYRDQHGPFTAVSGLEDVPGIGPAKVAALKDLVTL